MATFIPSTSSTLADWVGARTASLAPLTELIRRHVLAGERLHGDDTTVPVLAKDKTVIGRVWAYVRDDRPFAGPDPPAALFFYSRNRSGEHPNRHLAGYAGILQADAYAGFGDLYTRDANQDRSAKRHAGAMPDESPRSRGRRGDDLDADPPLPDHPSVTIRTRVRGAENCLFQPRSTGSRRVPGNRLSPTPARLEFSWRTPGDKLYPRYRLPLPVLPSWCADTPPPARSARPPGMSPPCCRGSA